MHFLPSNASQNLLGRLGRRIRMRPSEKMDAREKLRRFLLDHRDEFRGVMQQDKIKEAAINAYNRLNPHDPIDPNEILTFPFGADEAHRGRTPHASSPA